MILHSFLWYLIVALAGVLALPLAYRMMPFLPDRGLALARPLGLLLWGYAFWLLASLQVLGNDAGGALAALALVAALSAWLVRGDRRRQWLAWLGAQKRLWFATELLFFGLFLFWALVRAANPDASGTEKPMELAFINAILRSPAFPPADPWLAGYSISYYYFGYVMVALVARLAAVPGAVAFNLALATWFALAGLGAYGLLYNLLAVRARAGAVQPGAQPARMRLLAGLAPLFLLLVSNLQGFLELLHARGIFWQKTDAGWQSGFWQWLNIQEVVNPPSEPFGWVPQRLGGIWWWRASRVLQDLDWNGQSREIIDEFPAFSYLLGDLHPHVLAMPFVLLVLGLALNWFLSMHEHDDAAVWPEPLGWLRQPRFWLAALALGGLSFLNTWDFPIYLALLSAAAVLPRFLREGLRLGQVLDFLVLFFMLALAGVLLYLPFYLGFASQASGLLPSLIFFTRGAHFWVMFAPLLLPVFAWLAWQLVQAVRPGGQASIGLRSLRAGLLAAAGLLGGLWLISSLYGLLRLQGEPGLAGIWGAQPGAGLVIEALRRRLASPGAWLTLLALIALAWSVVVARPRQAAQAPEAESPGPAEEHVPGRFVALLVLLGAGLALFPEFFYLRDQFGWRMNTIFKFYFQAWIVWSLAAAYASAVLLDGLRRPATRVLFRTAWAGLLVMALAYPFFGIRDRTSGFSPVEWTLDGSAFLGRFEPDDLAGIRWLERAPYGVVAEAASLQASYTNFARVSTHSGLPAVLGWPGHQSQWRGGAEEMGTREPDLAQLYRARTWDQAVSILEKYNIRYVFFGSLERAQYQANTTLFDNYLKPVFRSGNTVIYEVPASTGP